MSDTNTPETSVEARFYVAEVTRFPGTGGKAVLRAVSRGDQNAQWASATPVGTLELTINNGPALDELDAWRQAKADVAIVMTAVKVLTPGDGHPFRQSQGESSYVRPGVCGDCGMPHPADA